MTALITHETLTEHETAIDSSYKITVDRAKYTLPIDEWGDVIPSGCVFNNAGVALRKPLTPHKTDIVTIDNEEFNISSLSDAGKKMVYNYKKFGSLPSHEKDVISSLSPIGVFLHRLKATPDYNQFEDLQNLVIDGRSGINDNFNLFCKNKEELITYLEAIENDEAENKTLATLNRVWVPVGIKKACKVSKEKPKTLAFILGLDYSSVYNWRYSGRIKA